MPRLARAFLISAFIGLHAATTLSGPGLHALPGWSHAAGLKPSPRHDHSHGPGRSSHQAAEECPVCHYLAQGSASLITGHALGEWVACEAAPTAAPVFLSSYAYRRHDPRGPPAAIALF